MKWQIVVDDGDDVEVPVRRVWLKEIYIQSNVSVNFLSLFSWKRTPVLQQCSNIGNTSLW